MPIPLPIRLLHRRPRRLILERDLNLLLAADKSWRLRTLRVINDKLFSREPIVRFILFTRFAKLSERKLLKPI